MTGNIEYEQKANDLIKTFSAQVSNSPIAFTQFLCGLTFAFGTSKEIVIVGKRDDSETGKMLNLVREKFMPDKILLLKETANENISEIAEFTKDQEMIDGKATVYVCENYNCKMPVTNSVDLAQLLN